MTVGLILLAGGKGKRFGSSKPKQFMSLRGRPVIDYSLEVLEPYVDQVVVVSPYPYKDYEHADPGATRSQSVRNGLALIETEYVIIHEAVRPHITKDQIEEFLAALPLNDSVSTAVPIIDGYLENLGSYFVPSSKEGRYLAQTPEGFKTSTLRDAFELAQQDYQDEVNMVFYVLGIAPFVVPGVSINSKITFAKDLADSEGMLRFNQVPIEQGEMGERCLVFGGTGSIGSACVELLPNPFIPTIDLIDPDFSAINFSEFDSIIYAAGSLEKAMEVNWAAPVALVEKLEETGWRGNVVLLSSSAATEGRRGFAIYSASKAALNSYVEARHQELAEKGIYLNAVAPAQTASRLQREIHPDTPAENLLSPQYVADVVVRYTKTTTHGHIVYLRKGFDG